MLVFQRGTAAVRAFAYFQTTWRQSSCCATLKLPFGEMMQFNVGRCLTVGTILGSLLVLLGCAPEVGSDAWCKNLKETPKGDWGANDVGGYAKHCLLK